MKNEKKRKCNRTKNKDWKTKTNKKNSKFQKIKKINLENKIKNKIKSKST